MKPLKAFPKRKSPKTRFGIFLFVLFSSAIISNVTPTLCTAATVSLKWNSTEHSDYYILYWGENSGTYTFSSQPIPEPSTSYTTTVEDGKTYYFSVKAFNYRGDSSVFSNEVIYTQHLEATPVQSSAVTIDVKK